MSNINIKSFDGSNYTQLLPNGNQAVSSNYASSARNSDTLDGYHANQFSLKTDVVTTNQLDGYVIPLNTFTFSPTYSSESLRNSLRYYLVVGKYTYQGEIGGAVRNYSTPSIFTELKITYIYEFPRTVGSNQTDTFQVGPGIGYFYPNSISYSVGDTIIPSEGLYSQPSSFSAYVYYTRRSSGTGSYTLRNASTNSGVSDYVLGTPNTTYKSSYTIQKSAPASVDTWITSNQCYGEGKSILSQLYN